MLRREQKAGCWMQAAEEQFTSTRAVPPWVDRVTEEKVKRGHLRKLASDIQQGTEWAGPEPSMSGRLITDRISQEHPASSMAGAAPIQLSDAVAHVSLLKVYFEVVSL